jgi:hydroxymethylpyrimidine pyrophosphatase-like HAD family hydrolase
MPYFFRAVAVDYDGTLTETSAPTEDVLGAVRAFREAGRQTILVTGRILAELRRDFPAVYEYFDAVVGENGGVLALPDGEQRLLGSPVERELEEGLRSAGVPVRRGEILLATQASWAPTVAGEIARLGLECKIVRNRGELMILPPGVSKGSGVHKALAHLGISYHSTVSVGDAENDHSLLSACELGIAVGNAVPALQAHADIVLKDRDGAGVARFLHGPVMRGEIRVQSKRWQVELGTYPDGTSATLPGSRVNVLVLGETGSGKSLVAGLLAEGLTALGYSLCVLDPEGDHRLLDQLQGVLAIEGGEARPPGQLTRLLGHRFGSVVVDLSLLSPEEKRRESRRIMAELGQVRQVSGLPHWIFLDEAPQLLDDEGLPRTADGLAPQGFCLVTHRPQDLSGAVLGEIDAVLILPGNEPAAVAILPQTPAFAGVGVEAERGLAQPLAPGTAWLIQRSGAGVFRIRARSVPHVRHWHKYVKGRLPPHRRFYFRCDGAPTGAQAGSIEELHRELRRSPPGALHHHLARGDFSRWAGEVIQDRQLAAAFGATEERYGGAANHDVERARRDLVEAIQERYLDPGAQPKAPDERA